MSARSIFSISKLCAVVALSAIIGVACSSDQQVSEQSESPQETAQPTLLPAAEPAVEDAIDRSRLVDIGYRKAAWEFDVPLDEFRPFFAAWLDNKMIMSTWTRLGDRCSQAPSEQFWVIDLDAPGDGIKPFGLELVAEYARWVWSTDEMGVVATRCAFDDDQPELNLVRFIDGFAASVTPIYDPYELPDSHIDGTPVSAAGTPELAPPPVPSPTPMPVGDGGGWVPDPYGPVTSPDGRFTYVTAPAAVELQSCYGGRVAFPVLIVDDGAAQREAIHNQHETPRRLIRELSFFGEDLVLVRASTDCDDTEHALIGEIGEDGRINAALVFNGPFNGSDEDILTLGDRVFIASTRQVNPDVSAVNAAVTNTAVTNSAVIIEEVDVEAFVADLGEVTD